MARFAWLVMLGVVVLPPGESHAVCRVVEPPVESGEGVTFDPKTMVLFALAPDQVVGHRCALWPDAGVDAGAGWDPSLGLDAGALESGDGGVTFLDAGALDAGALDAGMPDGAAHRLDGGPFDAGLWDAAVDAGSTDAGGATECPDGLRMPVRASLVHFVVQPAFYATGGRAGLVMPVPARPQLNVMPASFFESVGNHMKARVIEETEHVEDERLGYQCHDPYFSGGGSSSSSAGCGPSWTSSDPGFSPGMADYYGDAGATETVALDGGVVEVDEVLSTDRYQGTAVNASSLDALLQWLDQNGFAHSETDEDAFGAYVEEGAWFVAIRIQSEDKEGERVALPPVAMTWLGDTIPIPHRLQYDPRGGAVTTDAFVIAPGRMDLADGQAFTDYAAPTRFEPEVARLGVASGWLTRLEWTREVHEPLPDTELVEVAPVAEQPTITRSTTVRIPSSKCPDDGSCTCGVVPVRRLPSLLGPGLLALMYLGWRGRRRRW